MKTYSSIVFWLSFLVILGMVYPCSASDGNPGEDNRPNIIFIITDDQHRDQFNFLAEGRNDKGAALNLTPAIDRLADEGVILDQFYVHFGMHTQQIQCADWHLCQPRQECRFQGRCSTL